MNRSGEEVIARERGGEIVYVCEREGVRREEGYSVALTRHMTPLLTRTRNRHSRFYMSLLPASVNFVFLCLARNS